MGTVIVGIIISARMIIKIGGISITMCENLKELSEKLEKINSNLDTLLLNLNSSEYIKFGNHIIKSIQVNLNEHRAILNVGSISLKDAEKAIGEKETLYISNFSFENSFITSYKYTQNETHFTLAIGNLSFINNNKNSFNITIWEKPQQLNRIIDYVIYHELCHSLHFSHNKEFYNLLESKCKDWSKLKNKLETLIL